MKTVLLLTVLSVGGVAQTSLPTPVTPQEQQMAAPLEGDMTPEQKQMFAQAGRAFNASRFAEALPEFRKLHEQRPDDPNVAKFLAESAVNSGDPALAIEALKPIETRDPDDWQAVSILAHAYAQSGKTNLRDAEVERLRALHERLGPPLSNRRDFLLESVQAGDKKVSFYPALTPWGPFHVHLIARVYNGAGEQTFRVTLESPDFDQALFAKQHPAEAAKGLRQFSLDGYPPDRHDSKGELVQTHITYQFFAGEPPYDEVKRQVLAVVEGKLQPVSSSSGAGKQ